MVTPPPLCLTISVWVAKGMSHSFIAVSHGEHVTTLNSYGHHDSDVIGLWAGLVSRRVQVGVSREWLRRQTDKPLLTLLITLLAVLVQVSERSHPLRYMH